MQKGRVAEVEAHGLAHVEARARVVEAARREAAESHPEVAAVEGEAHFERVQVQEAPEEIETEMEIEKEFFVFCFGLQKNVYFDVRKKLWTDALLLSNITIHDAYEAAKRP